MVGASDQGHHREESGVTDERLDRLAGLMRGTSARKIQTAILRDKRVNLRVTATEKEQIDRMAKRLGLTVSDYLLGLHRIALAKERRSKK